MNAVVTACCRTAARYLAVLLLTAGLLAALPAAAVYARQQSQEEPPVVVPASPRAEKDSQTATTAIEAVELCFSLDCSARMLAPLPRALAAIEAIVAQTEAAYPEATLRLALVRYGDSTRRVAARGFTEDRKAFAAMLADTKLNKDSIDDYLGAFLERALRMGWSPGNDGRVAKRLYVIGSETPYSNAPRQLYRRLIPQARAQGIVVSTVFCPAPNRAFIPQGPMGDARELVRQEIEWKQDWVEAAAMGGGAFLQVAYGPEDVVAYAWKPREFADMARRMESADYLAQVVEEQEANKDEAEKWKAVVSRAEKEALIARRDRRVADWLRENGVRTLLRQQPN